MSLEQAIKTPKFSGYDTHKAIHMEDDYPEKTVKALESMGHQIKQYAYPDLYFGGPNAIAVKDGVMTGVGSIRRQGGAAAPGTEESPAK